MHLRKMGVLLQSTWVTEYLEQLALNITYKILRPLPVKKVHAEEQPVKLHSPQGKTQIIIVHMELYGRKYLASCAYVKLGSKCDRLMYFLILSLWNVPVYRML